MIMLATYSDLNRCAHTRLKKQQLTILQIRVKLVPKEKVIAYTLLKKNVQKVYLSTKKLFKE
jgi:hypothetical protein